MVKSIGFEFFCPRWLSGPELFFSKLVFECGKCPPQGGLECVGALQGQSCHSPIGLTPPPWVMRKGQVRTTPLFHFWAWLTLVPPTGVPPGRPQMPNVIGHIPTVFDTAGP